MPSPESRKGFLLPFAASLPGNLNRGHSGPCYTQFKADDGQFSDFAEEQRWALLEYLKTL